MNTSCILAIVAITLTQALAENTTLQSPLTMEQLMQELRIQGGNFIFEFDSPTYARVTATTTKFPDGKKTIENFDTKSAQKRIELFFSASALFVGEYPKGDSFNNPRKMLIKLSDCKATEGTRIINYEDKFAGNKYGGDGLGMWSPAVPPHPILDKKYVLHWYYKKGDSYEAKATITFSATPFQ